MSRSGYSDGDDASDWDVIRWRGAVNSAIKGARGQKLIGELVKGLDSMPNKHLIADHLQHEGSYCALGVVGALRGIVMDGIDPEDRDSVAEAFDIAPALAAEIAFENDEAAWWGIETPEERWIRMRKWAIDNLINTNKQEKIK